MPINDNDYAFFYDRNGKRVNRKVINDDPTDLVYDEETGTYGPRKTGASASFALKCVNCHDPLDYDDIGNWVGTGDEMICSACKRKDRQIVQDSLEDLDDIDKMLAEMNDD